MPDPSVRAYLAMSLDGFVAGPEDDLSWLQAYGAPSTDCADVISFEAFMAGTGAMLMGRRTHDVVAGFGGWPYGDTPVLVATHRHLEPAAPSVRAVAGTIEDLVGQARQAAVDGHVYVDGADLVRQTLAAGLLDDLVITLIPVVLGGGVRLFGPIDPPIPMRTAAVGTYPDGKVQVRWVPRSR